MNITLYINEKKIDSGYQKAIDEYLKRISAFIKAEKKLFKNINDIKIKKSSFVFILISGKNSITSEAFAKKITELNLSGYSSIDFIISENKDIIKKITEALNTSEISFEFFSVSSMQLKPDALCTALSEQIYRAYTINNHISYHK